MLICYLSNTTEFHCTSIKLYLLVLKSKRKFMFEKSIWQFIIIIHLAAFLQFINLLAFKFCSNNCLKFLIVILALANKTKNGHWDQEAILWMKFSLFKGKIINLKFLDGSCLQFGPGHWCNSTVPNFILPNFGNFLNMSFGIKCWN